MIHGECEECGRIFESTPVNVRLNDGLGAWVPMADRLPPTNTPILICASDGTVCAAELDYKPPRYFVWWQGVGFGGCEWDWDWECAGEPWKGVTHWMPLPPPPVAMRRNENN